MDPATLSRPALISYVNSFVNKKRLTLSENAGLHLAFKKLLEVGPAVGNETTKKHRRVKDLVAKENERVIKIRKELIEKVGDDQEFYLSLWRGKYRVHVLSKTPALLERILFQVGKIFSSSTKELTALLALSQEEGDGVSLRQLLEKIETNYLPHTTFFHSRRAMRKNRQLRKVVQATRETLGIKHNEGLLTRMSIYVEDETKASLVENHEKSLIFGLGETIGQTSSFSTGSIVRGGNPLFATLFEEGLLKSSAYLSFREHGLSQENRERLEAYEKAVKESKRINVLLNSLLLRSCKTDLPYIATEIFRKIVSLKDDDFLLLDINVEQHAMRAVVKKENDSLRFDLYDTGGMLDFLRPPTLMLFYRKIFKGRGALTLSMEVSQEKFAKEGEAFLQQVCFFAVSPKKGQIQGFMNSRSGWNLYSLWKSLGKTKILHKNEKLQKSGTCYAERIDAIQRKLLPKAVYLELLALRYRDVIDYFHGLAKEELADAYPSLQEKCSKMQFLKRREWSKTHLRVNRMKKHPGTLAEWEAIFALLYHDLACIDHIRENKMIEKSFKNTLSSI